MVAMFTMLSIHADINSLNYDRAISNDETRFKNL